MHNNILNGIEEVNRFVSIYIQVDYVYEEAEYT